MKPIKHLPGYGAVLIWAGITLCFITPLHASIYSHTTEHYEIYTDISRSFTKLVGKHMEAIYEEYWRRFKGYAVDPKDRFEVRVYRSKRDYQGNLSKELSTSLGSFIPAKGLVAAYLEKRPKEGLFRTLYHEGFHQFFHFCVMQNLPIWVNEGYAEYFSEANWNGDSFSTGYVPWVRLQVLKPALRENKYIPFPTLFQMDGQDWFASMRRGEDATSLQYCQAWSIVQFLLHGQGGRHRQKLLEYLRRLEKGVEPEEAFKKSFGTNIRGFERAWGKYVHDLEPDPLDRCRRHLAVLLYVGSSLADKPHDITDMGDLEDLILHNRSKKWNARTRYGPEISSSERERIEKLFECPADGNRDYFVLHDPKNDLPELYCLNHPGVVVRAYLVGEESEEWQVRCEVVVRETLPDNLIRAIKKRMGKR